MARKLTGWMVLLGLAAWMSYFGLHTFYIGRMPLPRAQALVLGGSFALAVFLLSAWALLALRMVTKRFARVPTVSVFDGKAVRIVLLALAVVTVGLVGYGRYVETQWLVVRKLPMGKAVERPVRIAVISDLHIGGEQELWPAVVDAVNESDPDLVLFLGDALNRRKALPVLQRTLAAMKARYGKYAVRGNWDVWYWHDLDLLKGTGFAWLSRETVSLDIDGIKLHLVGLPYRDQDWGDEPERRLASLPRPGWRLFLYHTPDLALDAPSADLYLAGHTHGGQVALPGFGALVTLSKFGKRFERGRSQVGDTVVYVNPGIGVEPVIPLRIGVRPEVTLVLLGQPES